MKAAPGGFSDELSLIVDGDKVAHVAISAAELNFVDPDVRKQLRTRKVTTPIHFAIATQLTSAYRAFSLLYVKYPRPVSDSYLKEIQQSHEGTLEPPEAEVNPMESSDAGLETLAHPTSCQDADMSQADTPDTPMRFTEKKRLHWSGKACKWFRSIERLG